MSKAIIAMSGGVDSSVAALLTKQTGDDCIGVTMKLFAKETPAENRARSCVSSDEPEKGATACMSSDTSEKRGTPYMSSDEPEHRTTSCVLSDDMKDARNAAERLGMPYYIFDFTDTFREQVMERFVSAYQKGYTPNPCIVCNKYLKFERLMARMKELGRDYIVTGHYAQIEQDMRTGRFLLKKAVDPQKDQSYVLYSLTQEQLAHIRFPLGKLRKEQVRQIAEENGFANARKHDSQDICFIPDGDYANFIERYTGKSDIPGDFVDMQGAFIAKHKGITHYTIGQRRGLGVPADRRLYVVNIEPHTRKVVLGDDRDLFHDSLVADHVNIIGSMEPLKPVRVTAKIRYRHKEQPAEAWIDTEGLLHVKFDAPQRAITLGQSVVLYQGEYVLGGGVICR